MLQSSSKHILDQQNKKIYTYLLLVIFCLVNTSCIKQMNLYQGDKEEDENGESR